MLPNLELDIQIIDALGKPISYKKLYPQSLVQAFIGLLSVQFYPGVVNIKDTSNTNRSINFSTSNFNINALINDASFGIVAGTDASAVAITDYKLGTQCAHGTGANQLQHSSVQKISGYTVAGTDAYFEFRRTLTNNSGSTITLKEVAIYSKGSSVYNFCVERTLVDQAITNTNGAVLTYKFLKTI